ncbi:MAG: hypothetical protein AAFZ74_09420 [Pseudomonadota bacterium]
MSEAWIKALSFAALPGAAKVRLERSTSVEDGTPTISYTLRSETDTGEAIGDDRDYDLLKAVMRPLEQLSETEDHNDFILELDLKTSVLYKLK